MAFNLEEWNKLSDAERERRYNQRRRDEERGKPRAVIVAANRVLSLTARCGSMGCVAKNE